MKFYNRGDERDKSTGQLSNGQKIILIQAEPTIGLSAFLKNLKDCFNAEPIMITNIKNDEDIPKTIYDILLSNYKKTLTYKMIKVASFFTPLLYIISPLKFPNIGFVLGGITEKVLIKKSEIYDNEYKSFYSELVFKILKRKSKKQRYAIFVDKIQDVKIPSLDFLNSLNNLSNIYLILGKSNNKSDDIIFEKFTNLHLDNIIKMSLPNAEILKGLYKDKRGEDITEEKCTEILNKTNNMHRIINIIAGNDPIAIAEKLSEVKKEIIRYIYFSPFSLEENDIFNILQDSYLNVRNELKQLLNEKYVKYDEGKKLYIEKNNETVLEIVKNYNENLIINNSYEYFYNAYKRCDIGTLKKLIIFANHRSKEQLDTIKKMLLINSLKLGCDIEENILDSYNPADDFSKLLLSICYFLKRDYQKSRFCLNNINALNKEAYNLEIMNILLLIRERKHKEAITKINKIIFNISDKKLSALLLAQLCAALLHNNDMEKFDKINLEKLNDMEKNDYSAHYLQVIAMHQIIKNPEKIYLNAILKFSKQDDKFGYQTVKINYNTFKIVNGFNNGNILESLLESEKEMLIFGKQHFYVLYNTIGLYYLMQEKSSDNLKEAQKYFDNAYLYAYDDMPKIFITINLAMVKLRQDDKNKAKELMESIETDVNKAKFDRVKQKYYINRAFIEMACKSKDVDKYLEKANQHLDRRNPEMTKNVAKMILDYKSTDSYKDEEFAKIYIPCYLEYWYINPLKFIRLNEI